MVDAIVSKAISDLNSIIVHEEPMPFAFIEELRKLCLSFKHIRPVLEDAERRAVTDNSALEWVLKLKDLAFKADDMMDEWRIAALSSIVQEIEGVGSSNEVGNQSLFNGSDNIGSLLRSASESQSLRSLVVLPIGPTNNASELFQQLRCLRVLDLSYSRITEVPFIIGSMKHLRYLDLSGTKIAALPMSVTDLCSLQTLRLNQCSLLCALPNRIDKLVSLRHLEFEETETLRNLDLVTGGEDDVKLAKLQDKEQVTDLQLYWRSEYSWKIENELHNVLENLRPHTNLQKLSISNYRGERFVNWVEDPSFSNLVKIKLHGSSCRRLPCYFAETLTKLTISYCDKLTWRPSIRPVLERLILEEPAGTLLRELPNLIYLKTLEIQEGCTIKALPRGLWKLRSLETLVIKGCFKLASLPEDIQHLTALQQLTISRSL